VLWAISLAIFAFCGLALTRFVIADNPCYTLWQAMKRSRVLMHGRHRQYMALQWRLSGWLIAIIATGGIASLWLLPCMTTALVCFYQDAKNANDGTEATRAASP
jgi:uncharacterized membrane protein